MEHLWVYFSLAAGILQAVRNAASKTLVLKLKPGGVTLVRFVYAIPFTVLYIALLHSLGVALGNITSRVFLLSGLTAVLQIMGTFLLISLFHFKNFAIAVNFTRTDNLFAAIFGVILFGQFIPVLGWVAIIVSIAGVLYSNLNKEKVGLHRFMHQLTEKQTWIGLASGSCFALAGFSVQYSNKAYAGGSVYLNAAVTLLIVLMIQTTLLAVYLFRRDKEQLRIVMRNRQMGLVMGTSSAAGSICWFVAFSLASVAFVRTIGQIEMVATILFAHFIFKERLYRYQLLGIILTVLGIVLLAFSI